MSEETTYTIKEIMEKQFKEVHNHLDTIELNLKEQGERTSSLERSRVQIWTAISVTVIFVGTIVTLTINAINSKIENGIAKALQDNVSNIIIEK